MKFIFFLLLPFQLFSQAGSVVTKEYYKNNKIRRYLVLDSNLNVMSETYYRESNSNPIAKIDYKAKNQIRAISFFQKNGKDLSCYVDFEKGKYLDAIDEISLSFRANFIFQGKQVGERVISYYENGKRTGPALQYDSTVTGKVLSNNVFLEYNYVFRNGEAYITGSKLTPIYDDTYSIYKGAYCNFNEDQLNGSSSVFYSNGKKKVTAIFKNGKVVNYTSNDREGNVITKIKSENGVLFSKAIVNGSVQEIETNSLLWFFALGNVGKIYKRYEPNNFSNSESSLDTRKHGSLAMEIPNYGQGENSELNNTWNTGQELKYKSDFDKNLEPAENIVELRFLFGIPYFYLGRYSFDSYDKDDFYIVRTDKKATIDSGALKPYSYLINEDANLRYFRNPFFASDEYHSWQTKLFQQPDDFSKTPEMALAYKERKNNFISWVDACYSYKFSGDKDYLTISHELRQDFEAINENSEIEKLIKSYVGSIVKNCFLLKTKNKMTEESFVNPLYKSSIEFDGFGGSSNLFSLITSDSLYKFAAGHEQGYKDLPTGIIRFYLIDNKYKLRYSIYFEHEGSSLSYKIRSTDWSFEINNLDGKIIYNNRIGIESVNLIEQSVKLSLVSIIEKFYNK